MCEIVSKIMNAVSEILNNVKFVAMIVASENRKFKLKEVNELLLQPIKDIKSSHWKICVEHIYHQRGRKNVQIGWNHGHYN